MCYTDSNSLKAVCDTGTTCSQGACVPVICSQNSDCFDGNTLTFDECINFGTLSSECRNTPINCASNLDCGYNGYLGGEYCSSSDRVRKNYQNSSCINNGTLNSYCNLRISSNVVDQCEFACYDGGVCIRCDEDLDCDDNNGQTTDLCINKGLPTSFCNNEGDEPVCGN